MRSPTPIRENDVTVLPAGTVVFQLGDNTQLILLKDTLVQVAPPEPEDTSRDPYG